MEKIRFVISSRDEDHTPVQCVKWLPEGKPRGIVVLVHGMAEYIERYEELADFLCRRGYLVTGEDLLGHGRTAESRDDLGYFCKQDPATVLVRDVHRLKRRCSRNIPACRSLSWDTAWAPSLPEIICAVTAQACRVP